MPSDGAKRRLRIKYMPLDEIRRAPRNPKRHALEDLGASFARFGFVEPIVLEETAGHLIAGHGRLDELLALQNSAALPPEGIEIRNDGEWLVPVVRGVRLASEAERAAYLIASNRLTEKGGNDAEELVELLHFLAEEESGLLGTGYSSEDVEALEQALRETSADGAGEDGGAPPDAATPPAGDVPESRYHEQYGVIVICVDATEQERVYEDLKARGLNVRVVVT